MSEMRKHAILDISDKNVFNTSYFVIVYFFTRFLIAIDRNISYNSNSCTINTLLALVLHTFLGFVLAATKMYPMPRMLFLL